MPQFDQFSFFNQVTWFLFLFFNFYFFISYYFLPKISYLIKFRKKYITINNARKNSLIFENNNKNLFFNHLYKNFYINFEFFYRKNIYIYNINQNKTLTNNTLIKNLYLNKINIFFNKKYLLSKQYFLNV